MTEHVELKRAMGSYLMGALDPPERAEVKEHVTVCGSCRVELASYAGLSGLVSRLTHEEVVSEALLPPSSLLPSVLAAIERQRVAEARRLRRWRSATGAALVATAAGAFVLVGLPADGPSRVAFTTSGRAGRLRGPRRGGQALGYRAAPAGTRAGRAVLRGMGGGHLREPDRRGVVGAHPAGVMDVDGATALHGRSLSFVVVSTGSGVPLLTVQRT
jgi:hypothetical protein